MLLQQIEQHPETTGLKRLLAVKKSLLEFEQRVEFVVRVVQQLMTDNAVVEKRTKSIKTLHIFPVSGPGWTVPQQAGKNPT